MLLKVTMFGSWTCNGYATDKGCCGPSRLGTKYNLRSLMSSLIHKAEQHRSTVPGVEAMTLVSNHYFPRHAHDQFGFGIIDIGAQRSWSGVGQIEASTGEVIFCNPGEYTMACRLSGKCAAGESFILIPLSYDVRSKTTLAHNLKLCDLWREILCWLSTSRDCLPHLRTASRMC